MKKTINVLVGITLFSIGILIGNLEIGSAKAQESYPTKHKGISVSKLGIIPKESMAKQTSLEGYVLQLRIATLEPGGQIARHDHKTRPGLVYTLEGSWTEGRPNGERDYPEGEEIALKEDWETDHWFYNRTDKPVKVIICDLDNR
jgi:quercetin dioxygenase-like cupin family protein